MNILFLTMYNFNSFSNHGIYEDLMRQFLGRHNVFVVSPTEKMPSMEIGDSVSGSGYKILQVKTGALQKSSFIKKGVATLKVASQFTKAIKKNFRDVKFDLIIYSTPPITLYSTIKYFKRLNGAKTFLLLKDIFPQNAIDIGVLNKKGLKGLIYKYFRNKEKALYDISDYIGCMSQANVDYLSFNNKTIDRNKVFIVPNSIEPIDVLLTQEEKNRMRIKYGLPIDKKVFVYGGNLGKPQDIPFIIKCLKSQKDNGNVFFFIVGDGTEFGKLEHFTEIEKPNNVKIMKRLPKEDFDTMLAACDVGLIFLDYRFTIPNYPSRLLSYMQVGLPVLACTDTNTDVGKDITENGFGWWCASNSVEGFNRAIKDAESANLCEMGETAKAYLSKHFTVQQAYRKILEEIAIDENRSN